MDSRRNKRIMRLAVCRSSCGRKVDLLGSYLGADLAGKSADDKKIF